MTTAIPACGCASRGLPRERLAGVGRPKGAQCGERPLEQLRAPDEAPWKVW